jgi:NAD(P)H dehydrogenase (quinone)
VNIVVILGHPNKGSFNHAIAATCLKVLESCDHTFFFHDLYEDRFDPALSSAELKRHASLPSAIEQHCNEVAQADGIIIIHPNWWGMPPAIVTGWVDRVLRPGVAYEFLEGDKGQGVPCGLLKAKCAVVFNTSNTPTTREKEVFGDPLEVIWRACIFDLCGVKGFYRRMFNVMITSSHEQRKGWLSEVEETVGRCFPGQS